MMTNLTITAYCICKLCCGSASHGLTASGCVPHSGITVAASRSFPFGTKMLIEGHAYIVQDRLAKRFDGRVDIFMASHKKAKQFGKRFIQVTICH